MSQQQRQPRRFLRIGEVARMTGLSQSMIYQKAAAGRFPKSVNLGGERAKAWIEDEIVSWQEARIAERETAAA